MLEELFKPYGCTISVKRSSNPAYQLVKIKCSVPDFDQEFMWCPNPTTLETELKPIVNTFISILSNGVQLPDTVVYDNNNLREFIDRYKVTLTPDAKFDAVLEFIRSQTSYDGQSIELKGPTNIKVAQMYFNHIAEWRFYLKNAVKEGFVLKEGYTRRTVTGSEDPYDKYSLTVNGLTRMIKVSEGKDSKQCFVAMSFDKELSNVYTDAIEVALTRTGFKALRVDKVNVPSDRTINDEIIAGIKKSHFTIADFTHHKNGVYFEAGYALGRGKKVLYTCREDQMTDAHFDIRNYQHIVWTDVSDFLKKLIDKIEAFIID